MTGCTKDLFLDPGVSIDVLLKGSFLPVQHVQVLHVFPNNHFPLRLKNQHFEIINPFDSTVKVYMNTIVSSEKKSRQRTVYGNSLACGW